MGIGEKTKRLVKEHQFWAGAAGVLVLVFVAYLPAIRGDFVWDDKMSIVENVTLRRGDSLRRIWTAPMEAPQYFPLTYTFFWLQHRWWGLWPPGYHLVNTLLHSINALLLWALLRCLGARGAFLAAAVFAVHPVHVESVAWISELKNTFSGAFFLATLLVYLRAAGRGSAASKAGLPVSMPAYLLSLGLFALSLLAKTSVVAVPLLIPLIIWWRWPDRWKRHLLPMIPFLAAAAILGYVTMGRELTDVGMERHRFILNPLERNLLAGGSFWFYLYKLLVPLDLAFIYPRWKVDSGTWWQYLFPLGAVIVPAALWVLRSRLGRAPVTAFMFYGLNLGPFLGFIPCVFTKYSWVADHFQYLASMGPIALAAAGISAALSPLPRGTPGTPSPGKIRQVARRAAPLALVTLLAVGTWRQAGMFRDNETLWRETMRRNPQAAMAPNNLGNILLRRKEYAAAEEMYRRTLALDPTFPEAHYNLGYIRLLNRDATGAMEQYRILRKTYPSLANELLRLIEYANRSGNLK